MTTNGFFAVLVCLFSYCGQPFDIASSTSQIYHAGRTESGGGVNLELVLIAKKSSKKLEIDGLLLKNEMLPIKFYGANNKLLTDFRKGDTLIVKSTRLLSSEEMSNAIEYVGADVTLYYRYKNKDKIAWMSLTKKEELYLP